MNRLLRGRTPTVLALVAAAAIGSPTPAKADDASYLAALDAAEAYTSGFPAARLSAGHKFCNELRGGRTREQIIDFYRGNLRTFGGASTVDELRGSLPAVVDIAQRELCPETLPPPPGA